MITELYKGFGWINDTGADIEPGSALEIKDRVVQENEIFFKIKKPTTSGIGKRIIFYNGPVLVPNNGGGRLQVGPMFIAAKNGSPALGDVVGPVDAQWYVSTSGSGFVYLGDDPTGVFPNGGIICSLGAAASGKFFVTTSTITARTGTSAPYTYGGGTGTMLLNGATTAATGVTLKNGSVNSIASGRLVQCKLVDGEWVIDVDYCN